MARLKKQFFLLEKTINKAKDKSLREIVKLLKEVLKEYPYFFDKEHWDKLVDLFYESLKETFVITSDFIESIYDKVKEFNVKDVFELTYKADGKDIEDRLRKYWIEGYENLLNNKWDEQEALEFLIKHYDNILTTETRNVENAVKKNKQPIRAELLIIEAGCDLCEGGEYPVDEAVDLPPYHPNCCCVAWYEETTNPDDIEDLDLEEDI